MKKVVLVVLVFVAGLLASVAWVHGNKPRDEAATEPSAWTVVKQWLEENGAEGQSPLRFRFIQPGTLLPAAEADAFPLPRSLRIAITRQGDEPARVVVERDGRRWEVTEDTLETLPEDVRSQVLRPLDQLRGAEAACLDFVPDWSAATPSDVLPPQGKFHRLEQQLEAINRELRQLLLSAEQLQASDDAAGESNEAAIESR